MPSAFADTYVWAMDLLEIVNAGLAAVPATPAIAVPEATKEEEKKEESPAEPNDSTTRVLFKLEAAEIIAFKEPSASVTGTFFKPTPSKLTCGFASFVQSFERTQVQAVVLAPVLDRQIFLA